MPSIIEAVYLWDSQKIRMRKKNQDFADVIATIMIFFYFLLFIFGISGGTYPILREYDLTFLGYRSGIVDFLGFIANRWWFIFLIFLFSLVVIIPLTFLITKTRIGSFRTYIEYLKLDFKGFTKFENSKQVFFDILKIAGFSIISFIIAEIITAGICSLIFVLIISFILSGLQQSLGILYTVFLITHIIIFPSILTIYQYYQRKRMIHMSDVDLKEFLREDGEVDLEKWRARTWGKKPYTYDWSEDEFFPITCFSCGSLISSNLTECPICNADFEKEIKMIDAEYEIVDDSEDLEEEQEEEKSTS
ncbi:MAG: hypothetical protein HGN29_12060 [Asgard group archaeon]|nr:hypothetical protein [Asgard group archaeon]